MGHEALVALGLGLPLVDVVEKVASTRLQWV
jgi:hypothetical protein